MAAVPAVPVSIDENPDAKFWAECRKRALELNIPAWQLAEEGFRHPAIDKHTRRR